jgi:hypothetical protein
MDYNFLDEDVNWLYNLQLFPDHKICQAIDHDANFNLEASFDGAFDLEMGDVQTAALQDDATCPLGTYKMSYEDDEAPSSSTPSASIAKEQGRSLLNQCMSASLQVFTCCYLPSSVTPHDHLPHFTSIVVRQSRRRNEDHEESDY